LNKCFCTLAISSLNDGCNAQLMLGKNFTNLPCDLERISRICSFVGSSCSCTFTN
jgi:hypothetical protein